MQKIYDGSVVILFDDYEFYIQTNKGKAHIDFEQLIATIDRIPEQSAIWKKALILQCARAVGLLR